MRAEILAGQTHLECCICIYEAQIRVGRLFVHEHPHDAASWAEACVARILALDGVETAVVDMCAYGMIVDLGPLQGPAWKRSRIISNSHGVLKRIKISCPNLGDNVSKHHVPVPFDQGRARRCQIYLREFSKRICDGITAEKKLKKLGMVALMILSLGSDMKDGYKACDALHEPDGTQAADDQSGGPHEKDHLSRT